MKRITISTKVTQDTVKKLTESGFCISDSLQVGLRLFLDTPDDRKWSLILQQKVRKKSERAQSKLKKRPKEIGDQTESEGEI